MAVGETEEERRKARLASIKTKVNLGNKLYLPRDNVFHIKLLLYL